MPGLEVSIDQPDCTSCGLCSEIAPRVFFMHSDGLAYVKEDNPKDPVEPQFHGIAGKVAVAGELDDKVIEAAEECPGECIYIEVA